MADAITLKRIARRLEQTASGIPAGEAYWPTLAAAAAAAVEQPPQVIQGAVPAQPFLAVIREREGFQLIARAATMAELQAPIETHLQERGGGVDVWIAEIRRVFTVS